MNRFDRLIRRLTLSELNADTFVGGAGEGGIGGHARLFGGLVAAQATMAAQLHCRQFPLHSIHAYFLRPGRAQKNIEYHVSTTKQGKNYAARLVQAKQGDELIFQLQASFHRKVDGVSHSLVMPSVAQPNKLPNRDKLRGRSYWQDMPIDVRMCDEITADQALPAEQGVWLRANGKIPLEHPLNQELHKALLVYASDRSLLDTAWRPHADQGELHGASLDHAVWFHHDIDVTQWLLYSMHSPAAGSGRGLAFGNLFNQSEIVVASVAQEGSLNYLPRS